MVKGFHFLLGMFHLRIDLDQNVDQENPTNIDLYRSIHLDSLCTFPLPRTFDAITVQFGVCGSPSPMMFHFGGGQWNSFSGEVQKCMGTPAECSIPFPPQMEWYIWGGSELARETKLFCPAAPILVTILALSANLCDALLPLYFAMQQGS